MFRRFAFTVLVLALAAPSAFAQTAPSDSTRPAVQTQPVPPPPTAMPAQSVPVRPPMYMRYAALSGSWLKPQGDFANLAEDGWSITLEAYQFTTPKRKIAGGTEIGYYDFGSKQGPLGLDSKVWFVPVDLIVRMFPKSDTGRLSPFAQGGIGGNYVHSEVAGAVNTDVEFGAQAGFGVLLHGSGRTGLKVDAVYHWVFSGNNDANVEFWSVRAGIVVPAVR